MTIHQLWIPGPLPGMNEILRARGVVLRVKGGGSRRHDGYSKMKRAWAEKIALFARASHFGRIATPAEFFFEIREPNRKRDPDNLASGCQKVVLDSLKEAGLLENDGWKQVAGIHTTWTVDEKRPGVMLTVREVQNGGRSEEI